METSKLDIKKHDLLRVSKLIYESDPKFLGLLYGFNKKKAFKRIRNSILIGKNPLAYENIYVATDKGKIIGILIAYKFDKFYRGLSFNESIHNFSIFTLINMYLIQKLIFDRVPKSKIKEKDFFINNICIDEKLRGKGKGSKILDYAIYLSKKEKCDTIKLNISSNNTPGVKFFKKNGFDIYDSTYIRFLFTRVKIYLMLYEKI